MKHHSIKVTAQCAYEGPQGRCKRMTTMTHPYCARHTVSELGVRVDKSKIKGAGLGLFAERAFKKGERIVQYNGEKLSHREYNERYDSDEMGSYGIELNSRWVLDAAKTSSGVARYVCDHHGSKTGQNCEYVSDAGKIWVLALRDIKPGEELYSDYGDEMHRALGLKKKA
jgi:SET domain-containing protein